MNRGIKIYYVTVVAIVSLLIISGCVGAPPPAATPTATPEPTTPMQTPSPTVTVSTSPLLRHPSR